MTRRVEVEKKKPILVLINASKPKVSKLIKTTFPQHSYDRKYHNSAAEDRLKI